MENLRLKERLRKLNKERKSLKRQNNIILYRINKYKKLLEDTDHLVQPDSTRLNPPVPFPGPSLTPP